MQNGLVKSAIRVFDLLELFDAERRPLRVTTIAQKLEAPQSSVSMLLKSLVSRGYMEFDATTREYCPSVRVAFLGDWATRIPHRRDAVQDALRRLANETGETVLLGRQSGILLQYLSVIESQNVLRFSPSPGTMRPMHRTATGIMLLSAQDDERIGRLLRRYNAEPGRTGPVAKIATTMRAVEWAREHGYYESANLATQGTGVIATLLATPIRGQRLSIGVGGPVDRLHARRAELVRIVLAVASTS
ncbi:IclR family transcriptional regulator [Variovorax boronicumulans]|uniref:IclR family transcriptional regulator n=1 Tax=Variovorax boronicumulans TaxID=436515 RepID=UPI0012E548CF|nr:helix-turn-helix domain-containing protein [Variovorax boronicumulans]GER20306.1 IclR family transcriptional regulator [Variovorax boronicumulans]